MLEVSELVSGIADDQDSFIERSYFFCRHGIMILKLSLRLQPTAFSG